MVTPGSPGCAPNHQLVAISMDAGTASLLERYGNEEYDGFIDDLWHVMIDD